MRRRVFVQASAAAVTGLALAGCASLIAVPVTPVGGKIRIPLRLHPQLEQPGGYLRIRPVGAATPLYVLALDGGRYAVLSPICTHLQCTVNIEGATLLCPCHGSLYDREGRVLRGPAARPLQRFPVTLTAEGELEIGYGGES